MKLITTPGIHAELNKALADAKREGREPKAIVLTPKEYDTLSGIVALYPGYPGDVASVTFETREFKRRYPIPRDTAGTCQRFPERGRYAGVPVFVVNPEEFVIE